MSTTREAIYNFSPKTGPKVNQILPRDFQLDFVGTKVSGISVNLRTNRPLIRSILELLFGVCLLIYTVGWTIALGTLKFYLFRTQKGNNAKSFVSIVDYKG